MDLEELPRQQCWPINTTCPICRVPSLYLFNPDRYFHLDGSDNDPCWMAISGGFDHDRVEEPVIIERGGLRGLTVPPCLG